MAVSSFIKLGAAEQAELKSLVIRVLSDAFIDNSLHMPAPPKSSLLQAPAACFVTLYIGQQLRGCIGTYSAEQPLWENVCRYSYYSAFADRRFPCLSKEELQNIRFEISILSELEAINNEGEKALLQQLQVGVDGLLLKEKPRSAIFLPSVWHSLATPLEFVRALKQKGGWPADYWSSNLELYRFSTVVISGEVADNKANKQALG